MLSLGSALELLSPATELFIAGCDTKSTFHCMSQSEKCWVVNMCNKRWQHFKMMILFDLQSAHEAPTHLLSLFTFPVCFTHGANVEWSTLSTWATSLVVVRGSASMMALSWSLSTCDGQPLYFSSSRLLSPFQNFLNYHCTVCSWAVPGPNALLMLQVDSSFCDSFWTQIRKLLTLVFCVISFP